MFVLSSGRTLNEWLCVETSKHFHSSWLVACLLMAMRRARGNDALPVMVIKLQKVDCLIMYKLHRTFCIFKPHVSGEHTFGKYSAKIRRAFGKPATRHKDTLRKIQWSKVYSMYLWVYFFIAVFECLTLWKRFVSTERCSKAMSSIPFAHIHICAKNDITTVIKNNDQNQVALLCRYAIILSRIPCHDLSYMDRPSGYLAQANTGPLSCLAVRW